MLHRPARFALALFAACLIVLPISACGDDEDGPATPDEPLPLPVPNLEEVEAQLKPVIDAQCEWLFACCNEDEVALELGPFVADAADCSNRILELLRTNRYPYQSRYLNAGATQLLLYLGLGFGGDRVEIDTAALDACVADIEARSCNPPLPPAGAFCVPAPPIENSKLCDARKIFIGQQALGEACTQDVQVECADGLTCIEYGEVGVCIEALGAGDSCFNDYECPNDLVCDFTSGTCATPSEFGEECTFTNPDDPRPGAEAQRCARELVCDPGTNTCATGECMVGNFCNTDSDCPQSVQCVMFRCDDLHEVGEGCYDNPDCVSGMCDFQTSTCGTPRVDGSQCSDHPQCDSGYCDFSVGPPACGASVVNGMPCLSFADAQCGAGWCDATQTPEPLCTPYAAVGQPCPQTRECDVPNDVRCIDNICAQLPLAEGATCLNETQCASKLCHQGACAEPGVDGEACAFDGSEKPCSSETYCRTDDDSAACSALLSPGSLCERDEECPGACRPYFNYYRCDDQPGAGMAYCGGS